MSKGATATHTNAGLPKLVGYRELEEAFGLKRRQLDRMQADGRFPRAMHVTGAGGNRRAWELQQVLEWFDAQRIRVTSLAVADISKLKPEQLEAALLDVFGEWAGRGGLPADAFPCAGVPVTADELAQRARAAANALADAFARLDPVRGWLVVAGLMPALRPAADRFLENMSGLKPSEAQDELRALALDILDQAISGELVEPQPETDDA